MKTSCQCKYFRCFCIYNYIFCVCMCICVGMRTCACSSIHDCTRMYTFTQTHIYFQDENIYAFECMYWVDLRCLGIHLAPYTDAYLFLRGKFICVWVYVLGGFKVFGNTFGPIHRRKYIFKMKIYMRLSVCIGWI